MLATTPAPTVPPPSRMAKRRPSSIAIGPIHSPDILTLSPGITLPLPSGRLPTPAPSLVRQPNCVPQLVMNGVLRPHSPFTSSYPAPDTSVSAVIHPGF